MQMTMDQAMRPGFGHAFALGKGSGYVMRSEKRQGYGGSSSGGGPQRKRPRRRRPSIAYIILTLIVSIILWPIGMVMLWRRRMRMQAGTKLLISLMTLCLSIFLIVFMLTVPVENERFTAFQDSANDWLDSAYARVAVVGDAAYHKGLDTWNVITDFGYRAYQPVMNTAADCIDKGVDFTGTVREKVMGLFHRGEVPPENAPEDTGAELPGDSGALNIRIPGGTPDPETATPLEAGLLGADGDFRPGDAAKPTATPGVKASSSLEPAEAGSPAPSEAASPVPGETDAPEAAPNAAPEDGADEGAADAEGEPGEAEGTPEPEAEGTSEPEAEGTPEPEAEGTPEPEAEGTPEPEIEIQAMAAADAPVYYKATGKRYHMRPECGRMVEAEPHTLREAVDAGKQRCPSCETPDPSILNERYVAWVDEAGVFHTGVNCGKFSGAWRLIPLNDAVHGDYTPCADCHADLYAERFGDAAEAICEGEQAPAEAEANAGAESGADAEAAEASEAAPEPSVIRPAIALKDAGEATVYHSSNGRFYHSGQVCKGMTGSSPYKLSDIKGNFRRCRTCDAPDESLIGQPCLWMDEDGLCHTSDACEAFRGKFKLILRDTALAEGKKGCTACGANEYLIPNTVLADAN